MYIEHVTITYWKGQALKFSYTFSFFSNRKEIHVIENSIIKALFAKYTFLSIPETQPATMYKYDMTSFIISCQLESLVEHVT